MSGYHRCVTGERWAVVGAGIVGLAVARELLLRHPGLDLTVFEKEESVALHQTGHNSGVVHSGVYYQPGSLKARLCTEGARYLQEFCSERSIPYRVCGKLVIAIDDDEAARLEAIHQRGKANGVEGLVMVDGRGIAELEPHAVGVRGLHVPSTAVVDFKRVAEAMARDVEQAGGSIRCGHEVEALAPDRGDRIRVVTGAETTVVDRVVVCAGLHADVVARRAGDADAPRIIAFRGEYFRLPQDRRHLVRGLIYPTPDERTPFLGVHLSRHVDDSVSVGPNAVLALAREGYLGRDVAPRHVRELLGWRGFRSMARRYWRSGLAEMLGSASKRVYLARARRYVPALRLSDLENPTSGVRAQAVDLEGRLVDDFVVRRVGPVIAIRNAPSPAATSAFAIAAHVCDEFLGGAAGA